MQRLLYISTARAPITSQQVSTILAVSRRNNAAASITGLLVIGGKRFLQVLEGPDDAVERTFARIAADPRHFAVVTLRRQAITQRAFPDWAMGHRDVAIPGEASGDLTAVVARLIAGVEDPTIRAHFTGFAEVNKAA